MDVSEKAMELWNAGYYNAVIPSDEIVSGKLKAGENGELIYMGQAL